MTVDDALLARIRALPCWTGAVRVVPLEGGMTNLNFRVTDDVGRFVVRTGADIPEHHVLRFNEVAVSRAAEGAGTSPAVVHAEPGMMVLDHIDGRTFAPSDIQDPDRLAEIVALIRQFHTRAPAHLRGPALIFWVFHVIRDYGAFLGAHDSPHGALIPELVAIGNGLEAISGPFEMVLGHNDLLAGNIMDDGTRLWLIDFDYAGYNTPLFDLAGLASNNDLSPEMEHRLLETYFEAPPDAARLRRFEALKCASLLRETLWSMVSELCSTLDVDYAAYTAENLARFRAIHGQFQS